MKPSDGQFEMTSSGDVKHISSKGVSDVSPESLFIPVSHTSPTGKTHHMTALGESGVEWHRGQTPKGWTFGRHDGK